MRLLWQWLMVKSFSALVDLDFAFLVIMKLTLLQLVIRFDSGEENVVMIAKQVTGLVPTQKVVQGAMFTPRKTEDVIT